ncbi:c-type cytochrome biogenesis protein CcmI [Methylobacillus arboreus]|uniref:c-type cytochrome biogenesis protein CcmI n=1 Tax=Methylobacillus arboreus TaxID=755170 RepID=UPI001E307728|nr:c-type cytochrome biogenesis protein CcmI [Methylobacillus arboreus]MCB5189154.1 c-type cytochrome biogenesis protein CcmI [Methylobacillus arboreus]
MLIFWIIAASLILITVISLIKPLLWPTQNALVSRTKSTVEIYRQQFDELEQDKSNGLLDLQQYQQAKSELEQRLLQEAEIDKADRRTGSQALPDRVVPWVLAIVIPLGAVLFYLQTGYPTAINELKQPPSSQLASGEDVPENIEQILRSLKQQLELDPQDAAGWALLARANAKLQRYDEAVQAFERAVIAAPDDPELLVDYAITLAFINNHDMTGRPEELVNKALDIDPEQIKALMLAASAAFDRQDYARAIALWQRLLQRLPADSQAAISVTEALDEALRLQEQQ